MSELWESPITYGDDENSYTGWTKPIRFADDLPAVALSVTISSTNYDDDDDDDDDDIWYANSCIWVTDLEHNLAPMFVNTPSNLGLLIGGGISVFDDWNHNSYAYASYDVDDLIEWTKEYTEEIIKDAPDWFVAELRAEIVQETSKIRRRIKPD